MSQLNLENSKFIRINHYLEMLPEKYTQEQVQKFQYFLDQLLVWNSAYNLTAITKPDEVLVKHLLDSLVMVPHIKGKNILDIGSGAGLPGIPLAIAHPEIAFILLDSNSKKTRFIKQMKFELGLKNLEVLHARVQDYKVAHGFNMIISRAFASLADIVNWSSHLLAEDGMIGAMKGKLDEKELSMLPNGISINEIIKLNVPELFEERHLILMQKKNNQ